MSLVILSIYATIIFSIAVIGALYVLNVKGR